MSCGLTAFVHFSHYDPVNLNDIAIIQYILKDDIFVGCVGILECECSLRLLASNWHQLVSSEH